MDLQNRHFHHDIRSWDAGIHLFWAKCDWQLTQESGHSGIKHWDAQHWKLDEQVSQLNIKCLTCHGKLNSEWMDPCVLQGHDLYANTFFCDKKCGHDQPRTQTDDAFGVNPGLNGFCAPFISWSPWLCPDWLMMSSFLIPQTYLYQKQREGSISNSETSLYQHCNIRGTISIGHHLPPPNIPTCTPHLHFGAM